MSQNMASIIMLARCRVRPCGGAGQHGAERVPAMQHYLLPRQDRHPRHVVQGGGGGPHIQPRHETRAGAVSYRALNDGSRRLHKDFTITEKALVLYNCTSAFTSKTLC